MLAAVDLDQLAQAIAAVAGLVDALDPVERANPDAVLRLRYIIGNHGRTFREQAYRRGSFHSRLTLLIFPR
ncbi:MAG TPA: hypothetical protein VL460_00255 [Caulobacteraceae bacterium]|nr:hypothetical protein [Caulobacteraceae bacterium]